MQPSVDTSGQVGPPNQQDMTRDMVCVLSEGLPEIAENVDKRRLPWTRNHGIP
jgi:hypothetical protein